MHVFLCHRFRKKMATKDGTPHPQRVMLWAVPRTLSTAFEKCMSFVPKTQIINEPFSCAHRRGPEARITSAEIYSEENLKKYEAQFEKYKEYDMPLAFDSKVCTYQFVKDKLEADYPGKDLVFCKDMAYSLDAKYDRLPTGYRHTFLIRHPYRVFPSHKKVLAKVLAFIGMDKFRLCDLPPDLFSKMYGFQEQHELMLYVQENCTDPPIIIDADDLLANPSSILSQYFKLLGIEFKEEILEWPSGFNFDGVKSWIGSREALVGNFLEGTGGFYDTALKSTRFHPPKKMPTREELNEDELVCADHSLPFYEKMYDLRLKPELDDN